MSDLRRMIQPAGNWSSNFLEADRRAIDLIKARLTGEVIPTPEAAGESAAIRMRTPLGGGLTRVGEAPRDRASGTVFEAKAALDRFVELHGDLLVTNVSKAHARAFRDTLIKVPKALPGKLAKLPLPELLKRDLAGLPQRSAQTVNKSLNLLGGVLARAERDGFFDALPGWTNPFRVTLEIAASEKEPYEPFTVEELNLLFASPVFSQAARPKGGRGEAAYWFPLIALFSGARRTEIAQLKVRDVARARMESGSSTLRLRTKISTSRTSRPRAGRRAPAAHRARPLGICEPASTNV